MLIFLSSRVHNCSCCFQTEVNADDPVSLHDLESVSLVLEITHYFDLQKNNSWPRWNAAEPEPVSNFLPLLYQTRRISYRRHSYFSDSAITGDTGWRIEYEPDPLSRRNLTQLWRLKQQLLVTRMPRERCKADLTLWLAGRWDGSTLSLNPGFWKLPWRF